MLHRFQIDQLLLFFLFGIGFILFSFRDQIFDIQNINQSGVKRYVDAKKLLPISSSDFLNSEAIFYSLHPEFNLLYSVNGGQNFELVENTLNLSEINNPEITKIPLSYHWQQPISEIPKGKSVVLKMRHKKNQIFSEPVVYSFYDTKSLELPVVFLTIPHNDLFSENEGIFVFGAESYNDEGFYKSWWDRSANYNQRGFKYEKDIFFQYFENGELITEQNCGLRISGNATRGFPQKSLRLDARKMYGKEKFSFPFFGKSGQKKYNSLILRNSGNDNSKTLFADMLMQKIAENSNVMTIKGKPVNVIINGNYWGIYNLRERITTHWISKLEDVDEDEITILEGTNSSLKDGEKKQKKKFDQFIYWLKNLSEVDDKDYDKIKSEIEITSFIDYILFETWFANSDWPENNSIWYKADDKKWKWILQDLDYGLSYLGSTQINVNLFDKLKNSSSDIALIFNQLLTNKKFKNEFKIRALELTTSHFNFDRIISIYSDLKKLYQHDIIWQINRWRMINSLEEWENNCVANLSFLQQRNEVFLIQIQEL